MLLGAALLVWFAAGVDWPRVGSVLANVLLGEFALACLALLVSQAAHAARYAVLIRHIAPTAGPLLIWDAVLIGQAGNTLLPLRAGNVMRPYVVSRVTGASLPALLFTTLSELLCDALGVLLMVAGVLVLLPEGQVGFVATVHGWAAPAAVGLVIAFFGVLGLGTRQARRTVLRLSGLLPSRRARRVAVSGFEALVIGLLPIGKLRRLMWAVLWTMLGWAAWVGAVVATGSSVGLVIHSSAALALVCALAIAMTVPQGPGFLGGFQVVTAQVLAMWGAPTVESQAVAVLLWVACFLPATLIGLEASIRRGVKLRALEPQKP